MTRTIARTLLLIALTAGLGGCTTVHVARPLGSSPATLDPAEWNGTWCDASNLEPEPGAQTLLPRDTECLAFTVVDPAAGVLDVVSPSEPGETYRAHLCHIGDNRDAVFVSVEEGGAFTFEFRARRDGSAIVAWEVSGGAFAAEIDAGRMAGRVDAGSVWLDTVSPGALARIADGSDLFDWERPLVLVRVSGS